MVERVTQAPRHYMLHHLAISFLFCSAIQTMLHTCPSFRMARILGACRKVCGLHGFVNQWYVRNLMIQVCFLEGLNAGSRFFLLMGDVI
jgi:hypothetical protein